MVMGLHDALIDVYVTGFAAATLALVLWNALEHRREIAHFAPVLIVGGLLAMSVSLVSIAGEPADKLYTFARDLLLQAAVAYLVRLLARKPEVLWPLVLALGLVYWFFYRGVQAEGLYGMELPAASPVELEAVGPSSATTGSAAALATQSGRVEEQADLDPNAELLAELTPTQAGALRQRLKGRISLAEAFAVDPRARASTRLDEVTAIDVLELDELATVQAVLEELGVPYETNELLRVAPTDNPSQEGLRGPTAAETGLDDPRLGEQWALTAWPYAAFAKTLGGVRDRLQPARLFILDTGVDGAHEDLRGHFVSHGERHDRDAIGHGTHVAGIAAAVANNALGVAGWWPSGDHPLTVSSIKVFGPLGTTTQRAVVQGIIEAADAEASVINLSLGGPSTDRRQRVYAEAVRYANDRGAIVVVAAGNSARDARSYSPANTPGVIAVAALDRSLAQARFSNSVDGLPYGVWAPGEAIVSTVPNGGYTPFSGTSMAAPQVAGLLTLAKAIDPGLTTREAYELLSATLRTLPQANGSREEPGLIDPGAFLERVGTRR